MTIQDLAADSEVLRFGDLLVFAENVLRGRGEQGILARIADPGDCRRFASALWLEGADGASFAFWHHHLCNILSDNDIDPSRVLIDGDSMCLCGYRLLHHAQEGGMALTGVSRAAHLFTVSHHVPAYIRINRTQVACQFPVLLNLVIEVAYGWREPASRRVAAWHVLHAIDQRKPLIAALASFFRVGPAAIRAMRAWRPSSQQHWLSYSSARRAALLLVGLPCEAQVDLDDRQLWRWLVVAQVIVGCTGITTEYLLRNQCLESLERLFSNGLVKRVELRRILRQAIRWLRSERGRHGGLPRLNRLLAAIGLPLTSLVQLDYCFALSRGWQAAPLDTADAIGFEGNAMRHCLKRYTNEVLGSETTAYSMRSGNGNERATLMVQPTCFGEEDDVELELTLAGFANGAKSIDAVEAMVALLRIVSPQFARVRF